MPVRARRAGEMAQIQDDRAGYGHLSGKCVKVDGRLTHGSLAHFPAATVARVRMSSANDAAPGSLWPTERSPR